MEKRKLNPIRIDGRVNRLLRAMSPKLDELSGFPAQFGLGDGRVEKIVISLSSGTLVITPRADTSAALPFWQARIAAQGDQ